MATDGRARTVVAVGEAEAHEANAAGGAGGGDAVQAVPLAALVDDPSPLCGPRVAVRTAAASSSRGSRGPVTRVVALSRDRVYLFGLPRLSGAHLGDVPSRRVRLGAAPEAATWSADGQCAFVGDALGRLSLLVANGQLLSQKQVFKPTGDEGGDAAAAVAADSGLAVGSAFAGIQCARPSAEAMSATAGSGGSPPEEELVAVAVSGAALVMRRLQLPALVAAAAARDDAAVKAVVRRNRVSQFHASSAHMKGPMACMAAGWREAGTAVALVALAGPVAVAVWVLPRGPGADSGSAADTAPVASLPRAALSSAPVAAALRPGSMQLALGHADGSVSLWECPSAGQPPAFIAAGSARGLPGCGPVLGLAWASGAAAGLFEEPEVLVATRSGDVGAPGVACFLRPPPLEEPDVDPAHDLAIVAQAPVPMPPRGSAPGSAGGHVAPAAMIDVAADEDECDDAADEDGVPVVGRTAVAPRLLLASLGSVEGLGDAGARCLVLHQLEPTPLADRMEAAVRRGGRSEAAALAEAAGLDPTDAARAEATVLAHEMRSSADRAEAECASADDAKRFRAEDRSRARRLAGVLDEVVSAGDASFAVALCAEAVPLCQATMKVLVAYAGAAAGAEESPGAAGAAGDAPAAKGGRPGVPGAALDPACGAEAADAAESAAGDAAALAARWAAFEAMTAAGRRASGAHAPAQGAADFERAAWVSFRDGSWAGAAAALVRAGMLWEARSAWERQPTAAGARAVAAALRDLPDWVRPSAWAPWVRSSVLPLLDQRDAVLLEPWAVAEALRCEAAGMDPSEARWACQALLPREACAAAGVASSGRDAPAHAEPQPPATPGELCAPANAAGSLGAAAASLAGWRQLCLGGAAAAAQASAGQGSADPSSAGVPPPSASPAAAPLGAWMLRGGQQPSAEAAAAADAEHDPVRSAASLIAEAKATAARWAALIDAASVAGGGAAAAAASAAQAVTADEGPEAPPMRLLPRLWALLDEQAFLAERAGLRVPLAELAADWPSGVAVLLLDREPVASLLGATAVPIVRAWCDRHGVDADSVLADYAEELAEAAAVTRQDALDSPAMSEGEDEAEAAGGGAAADRGDASQGSGKAAEEEKSEEGEGEEEEDADAVPVGAEALRSDIASARGRQRGAAR
ncbi:hypothetical protein FNF29_02610 [Cafeteria roenbergensis]|uniref:Uncharacterized protein n=1 Tax=Cafeteria roenbergensis TaxID=33653 RepID=A0A5A8CQB4_CAFRO|nr:hypothetical protein FNF29_02610 [Cafeteria roenbergensis]|eukprot:KAA0154390.1 hypothetical protein FNF29_02610 [Cafeteria roenbergensis]